MINLIKSQPLNSKKMGPGDEQLLLHPEVHWLSMGRVLQQVVWAARESQVLFGRIQLDLVKHLDDTMWLLSLSYLVDRFDCLNGLTAPHSLHTKNVTSGIATSVVQLWHVPKPCRLHHWCRHVTWFLLSISNSVWAQFVTYFKQDCRPFVWRVCVVYKVFYLLYGVFWVLLGAE